MLDPTENQNAIIPHEDSSNPDDRSAITIDRALEQSGWTFDHRAFHSRIRELRPRLLTTGSTVFIPMMWGMPSPEEGRIINENEVIIPYGNDFLIKYSLNTLRDRIPNDPMSVGGGWFYTDNTVKPDPVTNRDVSERLAMIRGFEELRFPHKPNRFNQHERMTALTDEQGYVRISLNAPYPLQATKESLIRNDGSLPVPGSNNLASKLFYAAYLREMGVDENLIYQAVAEQPRQLSYEQNTYTFDEEALLGNLSEVRSLDSFFRFNTDTMQAEWIKQEDPALTPKNIYRAILTSAHFDEEGNIAFSTSPKPPNFTQLSPPRTS